MNNRKQELIRLKNFIDTVDNETTLLLQNLQWDHKHLIKSPPMVCCKYVAEHRVPLHSVEAHEKQCYLTQHGYSKDDILLPDPIDPNADTIVKLNKHDITKIINTAASLDPSFNRDLNASYILTLPLKLNMGMIFGAVEPMSAERLQLAYSADERRAIHDAVVAAAPACHDLADLALGSSSTGPQSSKVKSRAEILSELRDMKRRRTRYRVAANTTKYSDVLRDVIRTQMGLYAEAKGIFIKTEYGTKNYVSMNMPAVSDNSSNDIVIKEERISPDTDNSRHRERSRSRDKRHRSEYRDKETVSKRSRDHYEHYSYENSSNKRKYKESSQDKYSKDRRRRDDSHSRREKYHRASDTITGEGDIHNDNKTEESSTFKHVGRYNENDGKQSDRYHNDSSKNARKYESNSKEHKHRSYREDSSKYDHRRKYNEHDRSHKDSNRHREEKHRRYYDQIKEEAEDYYEDSNDERRKRLRH